MKYELTGNTKNLLGKTLYQIRALKDFDDVKTGDLGGWVESKNNLSQKGNCWVFENAQVSGDARVFGNALVTDNARVFGNALVTDNARVCDDAWVSGNARVCDGAWVSGNAQVTENTDTVSVPTNPYKISVNKTLTIKVDEEFDDVVINGTLYVKA